MVIPCYNESQRLDQLFQALREFAQQWPHEYEVIIVDDGSKDGTSEKIQQHSSYQYFSEKGKIRLITLQKNQGKGGALKAGVAASTGDFLLTLDADMSTHPIEVNNWLKTTNAPLGDDEILIGSRELSQSKIEAKKTRRFIGNIFNFLVSVVTPLNVKDTQCGFKLYPASVAKKLFGDLLVKGWAHDVEILYKAKLRDIQITEMPIKWTEHGGSKVNVARDSIKMFFQILYISLMLNWKWYFISPFKDTFGKSNELKTGEPAIFRFLFAFSLVLLLFLMPMLSFDYGITGDEEVQAEYGERVYKYFASGGDDRSVFDYKNLYLYGGFFDLMAAIFARLGIFDLFDARHFLNSIFGFIGILFAGLLAKRFGGYRAGFFAIIFLALTPRYFGHSMNNPKDIPFAAAFIFTVYFIFRFIQGLPRPAVKDIVFLIIGIAISINIRIGGLLLIAFFLLFSFLEVMLRKDLRSRLGKDFWTYVKYTLIIGVVGYLGGMIFWPYGIEGPFSNPFTALGEMSNFSTGIRMIFEGEHIMSDNIPWYYIPKWMMISMPLIVLAGFIGSFFLPFLNKIYNSRYILFLIFAAVFPVAYAIYQKSPLYDGLRHFLFVIPPLVVAAALAWNYLFLKFKSKGVQIAGYVVIAVLLFLPLRFMVANHPNEYVYFNEAFGGIKNAYGQYETDYWMNSVKEATRWWIENEYSKLNRDSVQMISNAVHPVYIEFLENDIRPFPGYTRYSNRVNLDWEYGIFISRYIEKEQLKYWPPAGTIYTVKADGVPLAAVVKRPSNDDYLGIQAMQQNNFTTAINHFEKYVANDTTNEIAYNQLGLAYLNTRQFEKAALAFEHALRILPDENTRINLAVAYLQSGKFNEGVNLLNEMVAALTQEERELTAIVQQNQTDQRSLYQLVTTYQLLGNVHQYLAIAYSQLNNQETAQYHSNQAQAYKQRASQFIQQ